MKSLFVTILLLMVLALPAHSSDNVLNGLKFEDRIERLLNEKGFLSVQASDSETIAARTGEKLLLLDVPYTTIYGGTGRTEFVLMNRNAHPIRIEAKWQTVSGSTDEKLPYLYLNALYAWPEDQGIIVIDGPGWRIGALAWLRDSAQNKWLAANRPDRDIRVMSFEEFKNWVQHTL